jgi:hypothetical protein
VAGSEVSRNGLARDAGLRVNSAQLLPVIRDLYI